ncbi:MAG: hypothetical protein ACYTJ0_21575, partial [Planctomycetota bacterium]
MIQLHLTAGPVALALLALLALVGLGCTTDPAPTSTTAPTSPSTADRSTPPPEIQAWMDRLTVDHE